MEGKKLQVCICVGTFAHPSYIWQSVITCCLVRVANGWRVIRLEQRTNGNVFKKQPILNLIDALFDDGFI